MDHNGMTMKTQPEQLLKSLRSIRRNLVVVLQTAEKDNNAELSVKLAHLKTALDHMRECINSTPDIRRNALDQISKITDLHRQISLKDDFFRQFKEPCDSGEDSATRNWNTAE